jgi:hypothetical protein
VSGPSCIHRLVRKNALVYSAKRAPVSEAIQSRIARRRAEAERGDTLFVPERQR